MGSVYTVSQVTSYIKNMFTQDFALNRVSIKGEVSNCKYHTSGHIYFTLKDEKSALNCGFSNFFIKCFPYHTYTLEVLIWLLFQVLLETR